MGQKDSATKDYLADNDVFADAFNYLLYNGQQVIKAEDLQDAESALLLDNNPNAKTGKGKYVQRYRDVMKRFVMKSDGCCNYLLLGIEAQTNTHYAMPVRDMLYDAMQYAMQVEQLKAYHRER